MALATSTTGRDGAGALSTAKRIPSQSNTVAANQLQTQTPVRPASLPGAVRSLNKHQDWSQVTLRAGFKLCGVPTHTGRGLRGSCLRILNPTTLAGYPTPLAGQRAILLPAHGGQLPERAFHRSARPFIPVQRRGSRPFAAHILPRHQISQCLGGFGQVHFSCLSSIAFIRWFQTIGKAFDNWTKNEVRIGQK